MRRMEEKTIDGIAKLLLLGRTCRNCACTYGGDSCSYGQNDFCKKYGTCLMWHADENHNVFTYANASMSNDNRSES